jgi:hypothetical protein
MKSLQEALPNLAMEILEKKQAPEGQTNLYGLMSSPEFWKKALVPVFALTKADIKDLGVDIKSANNEVIFLKIQGLGGSKDSATQNADAIAQFIRNGGAYMAIRDLYTSQQSEFLISQAKIESKINATLIELEYQKSRLKSLENLSKRFPVESRSSFQAFDPKDSGAKYLPINTQIIAINTDINNNLEILSRLKDQQTQQAQIKRFLDLSGPLIEKTHNGLELIKQLLAIQVKLRAELKSADPKDFAFIDGLRNSLLSYEARFRWSLVQDGIPVAKKPGVLKFTAGGLITLFFLALMTMLSRRIWVNIKSIGAK